MSQEKGNVSELEFISRALRKGLKISRPLFTEKYDCLIDNGKDLYRVQVKSTNHWNKTYYQMSLTNGTSKKVNYKKGECDFFAIHIQKENVWYIIPLDFALPKLCLHPAQDWCRYDRYKEAWHLLHARSEPPTIAPQICELLPEQRH